MRVADIFIMMGEMVIDDPKSPCYLDPETKCRLRASFVSPGQTIKRVHFRAPSVFSFACCVSTSCDVDFVILYSNAL